MPQQLSILEQRKIEARVLVPIIQAFAREFGEERAHAIVRDAIVDIARQHGAELGKGPRSNPLDKVKEIVPVFTSDDALELDVVDDSEQTYAFDVIRCRFAEFYKEMGVPELGFLLSCNRDFALSEGISPDLELRRTQTIMEGATCCDFRFRRKAAKERD